MKEDNNCDIKAIYNNSDAYFSLLETRNELDFKNITDVIDQYVYKNKLLLEFGCGTGFLAHLVYTKGYEVIGVDISERFINHAIETYNDIDSNLKFQPVDFGQLPFEDHSFDCIYTCATLEHCYGIDKILFDFDRLLKPGGFLVLYTPNLLSPFTRISLIFKRIVGKRKRFHLYGSPRFFVISIWYNIKKLFSRKANLIYVKPDYQRFNEADEDVALLLQD